MAAAKILIAEDEQHMRKVVEAYLKKAGFITESVANGRQVLDAVADFKPDLLVLDLMLPGMSGEEVCRSLREKSQLPILMLTARGRPADKLNGFKLGADDYLVKPFHPEELIARIRAILRRTGTANEQTAIDLFKKGRLEVDFAAMVVRVSGKKIDLTVKEFKILQTLIKNKGQVLSREQLLEKVSGWDFEGFDRTIDVHIKNIRKKLSFDKDEFIITVYGAGYKFVGESDE